MLGPDEKKGKLDQDVKFRLIILYVKSGFILSKRNLHKTIITIIKDKIKHKLSCPVLIGKEKVKLTIKKKITANFNVSYIGETTSHRSKYSKIV